MKAKQVHELVWQSLEHELGGVKVYTTAITCTQNSALKKEWEKYREETRTHVATLEKVCAAMDIDSKRDTPGRAVVRQATGALVESMRMALASGDPAAAQLAACECVRIAETKDQVDWALLAESAEHLTGHEAEALKRACETLEDQEDFPRIGEHRRAIHEG